MSDCWYCYKEVESGPDYADPNVHQSCSEEKQYRRNANLCVFCKGELGSAEISEGLTSHESCRVAGIYSGYG